MMLPTLQATKLRPGFIPVSVYRLRTVNTTKITTEPVSTAHLPGKFFQARVTAPVAMSEAAPALFQFVLHSIFNGLHRRQFTGSILRERERESPIPSAEIGNGLHIAAQAVHGKGEGARRWEERGEGREWAFRSRLTWTLESAEEVGVERPAAEQHRSISRRSSTPSKRRGPVRVRDKPSAATTATHRGSPSAGV